MSRLASLALAALFLSAGTFASACPACDAPAAFAPVPDPPPQAVFEAEAPGALLAEERAWLLALEDGRFEPVNGRIADRKAPSPESHLLVNSAAWTLLGRRATERTALLRALVKDGRLPEEARGEAVALFWLRGTLVSPEDRDFLRAATLPKAKPKAAAGGFASAPEDAQGPSAAGAGPLSAGSEAQAADVLRALKASLDISPGADPRAAAAMNQALENLVKTPTGRELAMEFAASGARAKLQFGDVPNSTTVMMNGRRILQASGGHTHTTLDPPVVTLNKDYLDTDPDFRRVNMAATLGHELFGHAFEVQRAKKEGVPVQTLLYYRGDEAGSGLIGWLVHAELGGSLSNGHMWNYLADPERYHAGLKTNLAYYSTTLSLPEMRAPVATLESRVGGVAKEKERSRANAASMVAWRPVIEHFVEIHGVEAERFSSLTEDIASSIVSNNARQKSLDDIQSHLTSMIAHWKKPETAPAIRGLEAAAGSPYFRQAEERLTARADRLRGLVSGRAPEPTIPPVPNKLTWADLHSMQDRDKKDHPEHWEKKP